MSWIRKYIIDSIDVSFSFLGIMGIERRQDVCLTCVKKLEMGRKVTESHASASPSRKCNKKEKKKSEVLPRFELGSQDSKS